MKIDGLQEEYATDKIVEETSVNDEYERLLKVVRQLKSAIRAGKNVGELLGEIVIQATILANYLSVDLSTAIYEKMMTDHREGRLKR